MSINEIMNSKDLLKIANEFGTPLYVYNADSIKAQYETLFSETPNVVACHAGLECGILGTHYPEMEMVSFGPTIKGAHSPAEKVNIASVQKFWKFLLAILENIPTK